MAKPKSKLQALMTPRERVWTAVKKLARERGTFTLLELQDATVPVVIFRTVEDNLRRLVLGGYVAPARAPREQPREVGGRKDEALYKVVKTTFEAPRLDHRGKPAVQGLGNLAMWRAMRVLKSFDSQSLATAATLGPVTVSEVTARMYIKCLYQCGYLQQMREPTRRVPGLYRLIRDTGPFAPALTRAKVLIDRNLGEVVQLESEQEVCDGVE